MSNETPSGMASGQPMIYQIRIKGHLGARWSDWFEGMTITPEVNGDTLLTGEVIDQAALHGLLKRVRDLGMALVSITGDDTGQQEAARSASTDGKDPFL